MWKYNGANNFQGRPIGEIRKTKEVKLDLEASLREAVTLIGNLPLDHHVLIPEGYETTILTDDAENFRKSGPLARVRAGDFNVPENAITYAVVNAVNSLKDEKHRDNFIRYRGYGWTDSNGGPHLVPLLALIEGMELFALYGQQNDAKENTVTKVYGPNIDAKVPGRGDSGFKQHFTLLGAPVFSPKGASNWYDMEGRCNCEDKIYTGDLGNREEPAQRQDIHCAHEVAALYNEIAKGEHAFEVNPFLVPSDLAVFFTDKMRNQVIIERKNPDGKLRREHLLKAHQEPMLWEYMESIGNPLRHPGTREITVEGITQSFKYSTNPADVLYTASRSVFYPDLLAMEAPTKPQVDQRRSLFDF